MPLAQGFAIHRRPFAVEPLTGIMLPDGIFEASLPQQTITCHLTNETGGSVLGVTVWIKAVSDPGIVVPVAWRYIENVGAHESILVDWPATFVGASPGKVTVTFAYMYWFKPGGGQVSAVHVGDALHPQEIQATIFVTSTSYDSASKSYVCAVPEGRLRVRITGVTGPKTLDKWRDPAFARKNGFIGPLLITGAEFTVEPLVPYSGIHGDIPFHDPWWKVVGWVVFVVAIVAAIIAAILGHGTVYIGIKGEDFVDSGSGEPACFNCELDTWGGPEKFSVAGILSIIAMLALAVGLADDADPWHRGQAATPPKADEKTRSETVRLSMKYRERLVAGAAWPVDVKWEYVRKTTKRTLTHAVKETRTNTHLVSRSKITVLPRKAPAKNPVTITATFEKLSGRPYVGDELFVYALIRPASGRVIRVPLEDRKAVGRYVCTIVPAVLGASMSLSKNDLKGRWRIYVCAQDTNAAQASMAPTEAATFIGGYAVHTRFIISVDGTEPCPDAHDGVVDVT